MSTRPHWRHFAALTLAASLAMAGMASADTLSADGDIVTPSGNIQINTEPECDALPHTYTGNTTLNYGGNTHYNNGTTVTLSSYPDAAAETAGITAGAASQWIGVSGWDANSDTHDFATSVSVPAGVDDGSYKVDVQASGAGTTRTGGGSTPVPLYTVDGQYNVVVACDQFDDVDPPANQAPTVDAHGPYSGAEGSAISLTGSYTDPDEPAVPAPTFLWSIDSSSIDPFGSCSLTNADQLTTATITCTDNGSATVKLTVTDELGAAGSDTAAVTITNADPVVADPTLTQTGACAVSLSANYTDPGAADTHPSASITWGDGNTSSSPAITEPSGATPGTVSDSHTYTTSGTQDITVSVTDDDGGTGSNSTASFTTQLSVGNFLAPINTGAGPRSVFKLGSTIPVKVLLTDCSGAVVSTAGPVVNLVKIDNVPDGAVNEQAIAETPTNGKAMRWDGSQYHYNLSTKNSQFTFNNTALTSGSYKLWVSGTGIYSGTASYFDLK